MPQFDVYRNVTEPGYLLDCQSDALSGLSTRLVVPLLPPDYAPLPSRRLNPTLRVEGDEFVMMTISLPPSRGEHWARQWDLSRRNIQSS
jgi:toxin CcdB